MENDLLKRLDRMILRGFSVRASAHPCPASYGLVSYAAKDSDYAYSPEVFAVYYRALNRRQKTTYSGLFAEANKLYKQKDKEIMDLREKDLTEYVYRLFYEWDKDGYLLTV